MKRALTLLLCAAFFCMVLSGCAAPAGNPDPDVPEELVSGDYAIRAAVLRPLGSQAGDTEDYLSQGTLLNLSCQTVFAQAGMDLSSFDVLYLDPDLSSALPEDLSSAVMDYVRAGGFLFAEKDVYKRQGYKQARPAPQPWYRFAGYLPLYRHNYGKYPLRQARRL